MSTVIEPCTSDGLNILDLYVISFIVAWLKFKPFKKVKNILNQTLDKNTFILKIKTEKFNARKK